MTSRGVTDGCLLEADGASLNCQRSMELSQGPPLGIRDVPCAFLEVDLDAFLQAQENHAGQVVVPSTYEVGCTPHVLAGPGHTCHVVGPTIGHQSPAPPKFGWPGSKISVQPTS